MSSNCCHRFLCCRLLPMPWFQFKCCRCNDHQAFIGIVRTWIRLCLSKLLSIYTDNQNKYMHSLWFYDLQGYLFLFLHYKHFVDFILEMEKKICIGVFWSKPNQNVIFKSCYQLKLP